MGKYKLIIDTEALQDIQEATDWYNKQLEGLGARFQKQVKLQINKLSSSPHNYSIRYATVRCMIVKKFPFLVHFIVDESKMAVEIFAVVHTSRNPKIWEQNKKL